MSIAYFKGVANWAKVRPDDRDFKYDANGTYTVDLVVDEDVEKEIHACGLQLEPKQTEDGKTYYKFRRPHIVEFKDGPKELGPPKVVDKDNKPYPSTTLVGNGSEVILKAEIYDTAKGKGHRLQVVKVLNLVEYEKPEVVAGSDIVPF